MLHGLEIMAVARPATLGAFGCSSLAVNSYIANLRVTGFTILLFSISLG